MTSEPMIRAVELGFCYQSDPGWKLSGINLAAAKGQRIAVMGATGSGKTTFVQFLNGLIPNHHPGVVEGELFLDGRDTAAMSGPELVQKTGLVLQNPETQITGHIVLDDAAVGPANLGLPRAEVWRRAEHALDAVGLAKLATRETAQLSGGEQQRLAIAGILAMTPDLLVLDEPTSELDPAGATEIYRILDQQAVTGRSIVLVDHDPERILAWADKLLVLQEGRMVFFGEPPDFFAERAAVEAAGLRQPGAFAVVEDVVAAGLVDPPQSPVTSVAAALDVLKPLARAEENQADLKHRQPQAPGPPVIEVTGLSHAYPSGVVALDGVDLTIRSGEFVALLGHNGAGKTTFARHLINLLQPSRGRILIKGEDVLGRSVAELASTVGYVFQNPDHQIFAQSVFEEVAFGMRNRRIDEPIVAERVREVLDMVQLSDTENLHPFRLSQGERQRLAVASVLALQPEILVIDEPTTGQDFAGAVSILELAKDLRSRGHTVVMITHDMLLTARYADRAVVFDQGSVALDLPMDELFADLDRVERLHLQPPQVVELAVRLGFPPTTRPETLVQLMRDRRAS